MRGSESHLVSELLSPASLDWTVRLMSLAVSLPTLPDTWPPPAAPPDIPTYKHGYWSLQGTTRPDSQLVNNTSDILLISIPLMSDGDSPFGVQRIWFPSTLLTVIKISRSFDQKNSKISVHYQTHVSKNTQIIDGETKNLMFVKAE